jgi:hypothetical protein
MSNIVLDFGSCYTKVGVQSCAVIPSVYGKPKLPLKGGKPHKKILESIEYGLDCIKQGDNLSISEINLNDTEILPNFIESCLM